MYQILKVVGKKVQVRDRERGHRKVQVRDTERGHSAVQALQGVHMVRVHGMVVVVQLRTYYNRVLRCSISQQWGLVRQYSSFPLFASPYSSR